MARTRIKKTDKDGLKPQRSLPPTWKAGRNAIFQLKQVELDLFTAIREAESGNFIVSGVPKWITELDFTAFAFAAAQTLYNQSYQHGNEDVNSGVTRTKAKKMMERAENFKEPLYNGNIVTTLNDLCRLAYGTEPSTEQRKRMETLIADIHKKPVTIQLPNGDKLESTLCATMNKYTREGDGAITYDLYLNPIFGVQIKTQFGELPQDVIERLDKACKKRGQRKQATHYLLIRWLSAQDARTPHPLHIGTLVEELRMEDYFKENRSKAEKQILSVCDVMVDIDLLSRYDVEYSTDKRRKQIKKITFYKNPNYLRQSKKVEAKK